MCISWTCKSADISSLLGFLRDGPPVHFLGQLLISPSSHPASQNFGKHWSAEDVHDMFAPSEESVQTVRDWLVASGIEAHSILHTENRGWLALDIPVWQAEDLFKTEYYEHEHASSGKVKVGCDE